MKELQKETLKGYVELILKTGEKLIGKIPFDSMDDRHIVFLPEENFKNFYSKTKENSVLFDNIKEYVLFIQTNQIQSYEIKFNELSNVKTENNKPLPNWFWTSIT